MTLANDYQVHMLRIWQKPASSDQNLRVTLENTKTAVRVSFTDFEALSNYLQQQVEQPVPQI